MEVRLCVTKNGSFVMERRKNIIYLFQPDNSLKHFYHLLHCTKTYLHFKLDSKSLIRNIDEAFIIFWIRDQVITARLQSLLQKKKRRQFWHIISHNYDLLQGLRSLSKVNECNPDNWKEKQRFNSFRYFSMAI